MEFKTKPWKHQKDTANYIDDNDVDYYALFWDMGAGKTKGIVDILRSKCAKHKRVLKTLIITPLVVMDQFKGEIGVHSNIPLNRVQVVDGTTKPDGRKLKNPNLKIKKAQLDSGKDIFIINTDMVGNQNLWHIIEALGIEILVVDESHRFKSFDAKRTKAIHKFSRLPCIKYKFLLTGSPVLKDACDLWAQFYIMNPEILGANFYSFRAKYFYDANASMPSHVHFPNWKPKDRTYYNRLGIPYNDDIADLNRLIYRHANRVMKDDVLDLPPFIRTKIDVPFTKEQSRIYNELKDDLVAFLDGGGGELTTFEGLELLDLEDENIVSADLAIVKLLRLQQLVNGIFSNDDGVVTMFKTEREKILKQLLEELCSNKENKIIVWCCFSPLYQMIQNICDELKIKAVHLTGLQKKEDKLSNVKAFNEDKSIQVLIANQGAGGTGVNLTASNYSIYYSRSFNLEHDLQSEARNYRGGQTRKVTRIDLVTPDSIDEKVLEALTAKKEMAEDILAVRGKELGRGELLSML